MPPAICHLQREPLSPETSTGLLHCIHSDRAAEFGAAPLEARLGAREEGQVGIERKMGRVGDEPLPAPLPERIGSRVLA